ncbi:MAG: Hint domain-containing protein [Rhodobacteraceae bacterium]|nr:Hint domain-containing protein [Paracoccaceae bacterium]
MLQFKAAQKAQATSTNAGLTAGTIVMTLDGEIPVEHLSPGDRIITRDCGMAILKDIKVTQTKATPIRIKSGALGHNRPTDDLYVAANTLIHIRDWRAEAMFGAQNATVPAEQLIDGEFITAQEKAEMRLYSLVFDRSHIIYAGGLEVVTAC